MKDEDINIENHEQKHEQTRDEDDDIKISDSSKHSQGATNKFNVSDNQKPPKSNFGKRLREIRKAKNISIRDVSNVLHLSKEIISAIEEDNYRFKGLDIFVQGHTSAYAKFLEISSEEIDEELKKMGFSVSRSKTAKNSKFEIIQQRKNYTSTRFLTLAIIVILVIFVTLWQFSHKSLISDNNDNNNGNGIDKAEIVPFTTESAPGNIKRVSIPVAKGVLINKNSYTKKRKNAEITSFIIAKKSQLNRKSVEDKQTPLPWLKKTKT